MLFRSYLVASRRRCFSLLKARSIRFRVRYSCRSYSQGSLRLDLGGMTASAPWSWMKASIRLLSYPLSAMTPPVSIPASRGMAWETSARSPPVREKRTGCPWASVTMCILVLSPPRDRPTASLWPPFTTHRLLVGPDYGGVNHHVPVVRIIQQHLKYPLPDSRPGPAGVALVGRFPFAVLFRQVLPLRNAQRTPSTNSRLSLAVTPTESGLPGRSPSICCHCPSLICPLSILTHLHHTAPMELHPNALRPPSSNLYPTRYYPNLSISPSLYWLKASYKRHRNHH